MDKGKKRKTRRTKKIKRSRKRQSRKLWDMKGCGHKKKNKSCSICKMKLQWGGTCDTCKIGMQNGGGSNFYKPASSIPGPFVGSAWNGSVGGWPGVNGIGGDRNYLAQNMYYTDPQTMMKLGGKRKKQGKKSKKNKKNKKNGERNGGGLIPQDLVNLGRDISYNMGSAYNSLNGYPQPVNPAPYMDQLPTSKSIII